MSSGFIISRLRKRKKTIFMSKKRILMSKKTVFLSLWPVKDNICVSNSYFAQFLFLFFQSFFSLSLFSKTVFPQNFTMAKICMYGSFVFKEPHCLYVTA